jgi:hypothetical protein
MTRISLIWPDDVRQYHPIICELDQRLVVVAVEK